MLNRQSEQWQKRACRVLPGGVNSPVRSFGSVGGKPLFIREARGAWLFDEDGNRYLDYLSSWGPLILGHNDPRILAAVEEAVRDGLSFGISTSREVLMAEQMVEMVGPLDMVRMVNSGTEAVMSALRLARGATGRNRIIKFSGGYHGHGDSMLVQAGSGPLTSGMPSSGGVPDGTVQDTLVASYNHPDTVEALFDRYPEDIAAVIVEPVAGNMGVIGPEPGFLEGLRRLCDRHGSLLVFDEVITGFRLGPGGAMDYFGVEADLVTYGKIIGGGMPVGTYGGRRALMEQVSPLGPVYQAGTLSGNPVTMAAGLATLKILRDDPDVYDRIGSKGTRLAQGIRRVTDLTVNQVESMVGVFARSGPVKDAESSAATDPDLYTGLFQFMLEQGILLPPSRFETLFISDAHTNEEVDYTVECFRQFQESRS